MFLGEVVSSSAFVLENTLSEVLGSGTLAFGGAFGEVVGSGALLLLEALSVNPLSEAMRIHSSFSLDTTRRQSKCVCLLEAVLTNPSSSSAMARVPISGSCHRKSELRLDVDLLA